MSKKGKKNVYKEFEEKPKGNLKYLSDTLDQNHQIKTHFFAFMPNDFIEPQNILFDKENYLIMSKLSADLKALLQANFQSFWSTMKFSHHFQKCLDSFLRHAKKPTFNHYFREEKTIHIHDNHLTEIMDDIYEQMFNIISRIVFGRLENPEKFEEFGCKTLIYDCWLLDIPKMYDLIMIYGGKNKTWVQEILTTTFSLNSEYEKDFIDSLNVLNKKILQACLTEISEIKRRDRNVIELSHKDTEKKLDALIVTLDTTKCLSEVWDFFPFNCCEQLFMKEETSIQMETLFYDIESSKTSWKFHENQEILNMMNQTLENIIHFFVGLLRFFETALYNSKITSKNGEKYTGRLNFFIKDFGKAGKTGKKEQKSQSLLQYISKDIDFSFLSNLPGVIKLDPEEASVFIVTTASLKENVLKEEKRIEKELIGEDHKSQEDEEEEKNYEPVVDEEELQHLDEDVVKKFNELDRHHSHDPNELIISRKPSEEVGKIVEVYKKKDKTKDYELDEEERQRQAEFIKQSMMYDLYDDEYDDTWDNKLTKGVLEGNVEELKDDEDEDDEERMERNKKFEGERGGFRGRRSGYGSRDRGGYSGRGRDKYSDKGNWENQEKSFQNSSNSSNIMNQDMISSRGGGGGYRGRGRGGRWSRGGEYNVSYEDNRGGQGSRGGEFPSNYERKDGNYTNHDEMKGGRGANQNNDYGREGGNYDESSGGQGGRGNRGSGAGGGGGRRGTGAGGDRGRGGYQYVVKEEPSEEQQEPMISRDGAYAEPKKKGKKKWDKNESGDFENFNEEGGDGEGKKELYGYNPNFSRRGARGGRAQTNNKHHYKKKY